ncbi:MAG: hypothetical protein NC342_08350 [Pseudoflavonifractor sp.]|nr:hypothetical protein [Alloprevotella sp.]MCM1117531.1 hypothetical protein [Pseudoflavonifractor sp.]
MKTRLIALLMLVAAIAAPLGALALAPSLARSGWEKADAPRRSLAPGALEVVTSGQWVYVSSSEEVKVEILTVLGQTLTCDTLPPGTHRFHIGARGIYILRAASSTYRITL